MRLLFCCYIQNSGLNPNITLSTNVSRPHNFSAYFLCSTILPSLVGCVNMMEIGWVKIITVILIQLQRKQPRLSKRVRGEWKQQSPPPHDDKRIRLRWERKYQKNEMNSFVSFVNFIFMSSHSLLYVKQNICAQIITMQWKRMRQQLKTDYDIVFLPVNASSMLTYIAIVNFIIIIFTRRSLITCLVVISFIDVKT